MKLFRTTFRIMRNLYHFILELSKRDNFYWRMASCQAINSTIDETAVVYGNYALANVTIGFSSYVSHNAYLSNTAIGKFCSIGPNLVSGWGIHPINGISTHPAFYSSLKKSKITFCEKDLLDEYKPIKIGNDVFIGANVTILDGVVIGDGAVIGAGAVVSKDIPPYAIAVGCPIKIVKYRFSAETIENLIKKKWWDNPNSFRHMQEKFFHVSEFLDQYHNVQN